MRKMQEADYSLVSYSFTLRCSERNDQENGSVELVVREGSVQKFRQMPEVDAAYYKGEPGDLIHIGTEEAWRHTVMITGVIRNEKEEVLDYLVHSNTADIKEFPVSLIGYPKQMLTKIYGWNG